ncbi:MAG: single-stranded-DNA-specific exonuclease RecJ [Spirochaetia bacterium]
MNENTFLAGTIIASKQAIDPAEIRKICNLYSISALEATILLRRGISNPKDLVYFLETSAIFLENPFLFNEMSLLIERIFSAIEEKEIIAILGDSDADGISSTVLMVEYFESLGISVLFRVPVGDDAYGLTTQAINDFKAKNTTLIICVDNGSTAHTSIEYAHKLGIDVVIIDHHSASEKPQKAYAMINPHIEPAYKNKTISASALVLKVLFALDFAKTPYYGRGLCLVSVNEGSHMLEVETQIIYNLVAGQKKTFILDVENNNSEDFLKSIQGLPLLTFGATQAIQLLSSFFHADVYIEDIANWVPPQFSRLKNTNLDELRLNSSLLKFFPEKKSRIEFIYSLYYMSVVYNQDQLHHYWNGFDLATIGLVADIMPMMGENRIITRIGLKAIEQKKRPALRLLLNELQLLDQKIDTKTIGWKIGPLLNASGRMGQADKAIQFFLEKEFSLQQKLLLDLVEMGQKRREQTEYWFAKIYADAHTSYEKFGQKAIFVYHQDLPCGLTGLLASRLNRTFAHTLVIVAGQRNSTEISGSLRTDLDALTLEFFDAHQALFLDYGGHQYAGGFSAKSENIPKIRSAVPAFVQQANIEINNIEKKKEFDAEIPAKYFDENIFSTVQKLSPYGDKFPMLTFFTAAIIITQIQMIGKKSDHLKLSLKFDTHVCSGLWWNSSQFVEHLNVGTVVDILYRLDTDMYLEEKKIYIIDLKVVN